MVRMSSIKTSQKIFWRQIATEKLYFRVGCDMSHDTRYFRFCTRSLVETFKFIEVSYLHYATAKHTDQVQISMHDNNGKPFISTLYNILFAP